MSYNSFLIKDEKTVLLDTVDKAVSGRFFENLAFALEGRTLDYIVVNHMEPDHCATLGEIILRHPNASIIVNAKTLVMIKQFFDFDIDSRAIIVKDGDILATGRHTLSFYTAPMVHWPEVMVTYDAEEKVLFSVIQIGVLKKQTAEPCSTGGGHRPSPLLANPAPFGRWAVLRGGAL